MTEPEGLMLSGTWAAAKLAAALWFGQLSLWMLRRGTRMPAWEIVLSLATLVASAWSWRATELSDSWRTGWLIHSVIAACMLIESLRSWISPADKPSPTRSGKPFVAAVIAVVGSGLALSIVTYSAWQDAPTGWLVRGCIAGQLLTSTMLFGVLLASTLELTVGALGTELLGRAWRRLTVVGTFGIVAQMLLGMTVIAKLKPSETIEQTAAPVLFAFGLATLAYIAWCVPRRMAYLARMQTIEGQPSLALSGWIGLLCLALAMTLPAQWPWVTLSLP